MIVSEPLLRNWFPNQKLVVLIGPEGDFTAEEVLAAENAGFTPIHLGQSRLRTETAGLVAVATVYAALAGLIFSGKLNLSKGCFQSSHGYIILFLAEHGLVIAQWIQ